MSTTLSWETIFELVRDTPQPEFHAHLLDTLQGWHENGDRDALLYAMRLCLSKQWLLPAWVQVAALSALDSWGAGSSKTLDAAFGVAPRQGQEAAQRKRARIKFAAYQAVLKEKAASAGDLLSVFAKVGAQFNISEALAKKYYYEIHAAIAETGLELLGAESPS